MSVSQEVRAALINAVRDLNTKGAKGSAVAYRTLSDLGRISNESVARTEALSQLNQMGRAWYVIAGIQDFILKADLRGNLSSTAFGGIRYMCAIPARGTHYLVALDISVDVNGGAVVTQWVTRQPVSAQNIPILLSSKSPTMRDSELSGDYFEKYSEINAVTGSIRRTAEGMEKAVLQRLAEKLKQMRS